MNTAIEVRAVASLEPSTISEATALARAAVASKLYAIASPEAALMILLTGRDLGLTASQSLRAVYVVNGKPVVSADAMVAAVRRSGLCESWRTVESTEQRCTIETRRRGETEVERETFSIEDAKRARLDTKDVWRAYPRDMLRHRAAAGLARRVYPDVILGCYVPGELDSPGEARAASADASSAEPVSAEAVAEARYQSGPQAPQAPEVVIGRDPRTAPRFVALVDALANAIGGPDVVAAWLEHGERLVSDGADVLAEGRRETLAAWNAFDGNGGANLAAAISEARTAREPADEAKRKRARKGEATAPLERSADYVSRDEWATRLAGSSDAGRIAGGYHKRQAAWRHSGELAAVRADTVDRLCSILAASEAEASAYLDACSPERRRTSPR